MKAIVKTRLEEGNVELKELDVPRCGPGEVLIKSKAAPIGSDVRVYNSDPVMMRVTKPPVTIGSENSGEIVEIGPDVKKWKSGDRVVCELIVSSCGKCSLCAIGRPFMCPNVVTLGRGHDGSFAEYFTAPAKYLHPIPDNVSFEDGAMAEDLGVVIAAIDENNIIKPGDTVVVLGPGPMGLLSLQVAKKNGADKVIICGISEDKNRLQLAKQLGADDAIDIQREDVVALVDNVTNGEGADAIILATGSEGAVEQAFKIIKKYGTLSVIGFPPGPIKVAWHEVPAKALKIIGGWGASSSSAWEKALQCISNKSVNVNPLITHRYPLNDWEIAFETFKSCKGLKVVLYP